MSLLSWSIRRNLVTSCEHHGGADQVVVLADRQDARQVEPLVAVVAEGDRLLHGQPAGSRGRPPRTSASACLSGAGAAQGIAPSLGAHAQDAAGRRVGPLDGAGRIDHDHRVGERVDRRLRRPLGPQQPRRAGGLVLADAAGHRVEGVGQFAQLVVGDDRDDLIVDRRATSPAPPVSRP